MTKHATAIGTLFRRQLLSSAGAFELGSALRIRIPGQLDESSARLALNRAGCHLITDRHLGLFGKESAQCHATNSCRIAEFQHPPRRSLDCAQCHQAPPSHCMMHFDMISKKIASQEDAQVAGCCGSTRVASLTFRPQPNHCEKPL